MTDTRRAELLKINRDLAAMLAALPHGVRLFDDHAAREAAARAKRAAEQAERYQARPFGKTRRRPGQQPAGNINRPTANKGR